MAIRAIVFDVVGVLELVRDDAWPEVWISRWASRMSLAAGHVAAVLAEHEPVGDMATGEMSEAQMQDMYAEALGLDQDQADRMMAEMWDEYCRVLDARLRDFAAELRPQYATAILSDSADGARREEQRRYGFEQIVDVIIYSREVGLAKPDPAISRLTEKRLGVEPNEIVFLDDHKGHVDAAGELGWHAVWHRDTPTSVRAINSLISAS